ncbi:membrane protein [Pseudoxanthomonas suwonensis]|uniref:membrane protein n=1 Tax=Pseudoxanthomonas suwonensis TaxID=314722 RepID=UPI0004644C23|nr:membrane protein [Pseudoxanthomonas suwonensis]
MTLLRLLVLVAFLAAGLVIGSLNTQRIVLDFGLAEIVTTTGIAVMVSLLAGVLLGGGIVMATTVLPLQARLRRASRPAATIPPPAEAPRPPFQDA